MGLTLADDLPRTLQIEINEWQNMSWGFHSIHRTNSRWQVAVRSDGSRANHWQYTEYRHYLLPVERGTGNSVYLRREHAGYVIDHQSRSISGGLCGCNWTPNRAYLDDHDCSHTAKEWFPESEQLGKGQVSGFTVIHYRRTGASNEVEDVAFAPSLGCEVMEQDTRWPGTWGIPGARWHYRVTSYQAGEPDPKLFELPRDYRTKVEH